MASTRFQDYWRNPQASKESQTLKNICVPEFFINLTKVTLMVTSTLLKYVKPDESIIELGCGTGRNLAGLRAVGYTNLYGVEINKESIALGRKSFPLLEGITIDCAAIEDVINDLPEVDCIYTQGVLMHIPPTSEWIFEVMSRKARKVIMTSENEAFGYTVAWKRDYSKIFTGFGWKQLEWEDCEKYGPDLPKTTIKRAFGKDKVDESPSPQLPEQSAVVAPSPSIPERKGSKRLRKHTTN